MAQKLVFSPTIVEFPKEPPTVDAASGEAILKIPTPCAKK
jgi:hypothetical protein